MESTHFSFASEIFELAPEAAVLYGRSSLEFLDTF